MAFIKDDSSVVKKWPRSRNRFKRHLCNWLNYNPPHRRKPQPNWLNENENSSDCRINCKA